MKHKYKPLKDYDDCSVEMSKEEKEQYPTISIDLGPEQLEGLELNSEVVVTLRGTVEALRSDTDDSWGTGSSIRLSLLESGIEEGKKGDAFLDELMEED